MLGVGVSSFSHLGGVHYQNEHAFEPYVARVEAGELPIARAYGLADDERLVREFILQMKLGRIDASYFQEKFGVDVRERFAAGIEKHQNDGWLTVEADGVRLTPAGFGRVDQLLPEFFRDEHQNARYA